MTVWPLDFLALKCMHSTIPNFTHLTSALSTQSLSVSVCLHLRLSVFVLLLQGENYPPLTHTYLLQVEYL